MLEPRPRIAILEDEFRQLLIAQVAQRQFALRARRYRLPRRRASQTADRSDPPRVRSRERRRVEKNHSGLAEVAQSAWSIC
jgi:hypothetical protein